MTRLLRAAILITFIFSAKNAFAANWYVLKGATGSNNGTSWTNAWNELNQINFSTVACGDTVWIAGNNGGAAYTGNLSPTKVCTAGTVLNIMRVRATDSVPVAAPGWVSTFDSQVTATNINIPLGGAFWTLDGRVGDAQSGVAYGIQLNNSTDGWLGVIADPSSGTVAGITVSHVEIHGPSCVTAGTCNSANWALALQNGSNFSVTVDHSWFHQFGEVIHGPTGKSNSLVLQYSYIGEDVKVNNNEHEDLLYTSDPCAKMTFIGNRWYSSGNDGIFMDNAGCVNGFVFINNVFFHWGGWAMEFGKTGTCGPYIILNNTFANDGLGADGAGGEYPYGFINTGGCAVSPSSSIANNILYNTSLGGTTNTQTVFNAGTTASGGGFSCGTGCFSYSLASPIQNFNGFVNFVPAGSNSQTIVRADLHLSSAGKTLFQGKGENLTAQCSNYPALCTDLDGNARPATGAWDLGAYVFSGSQAQVPQPPTALSATVQ
jgi:hypothetical protein